MQYFEAVQSGEGGVRYLGSPERGGGWRIISDLDTVQSGEKQNILRQSIVRRRFRTLGQSRVRRKFHTFRHS